MTRDPADRPVRPGRTAAAEWQVPHQFTPDHVTGQLTDVDQPPTFRVYGTSAALRVARELGWLTTWGYLADTTAYGCGRYPQFENKGGDLDLVAELRAVWYAIGRRLADGPVTVITSTCDAACQLAEWQDGSTALPGGYQGSGRRAPTIERLRRVIAGRPGNLTVSTTGLGVLGAGAEGLAVLAEQWARNNIDKADIQNRAAELATTFLAGQGRL